MEQHSKTIINNNANGLEIKNKNHRLILFLLYKFRYLTTRHFQKLFNHKDPHRVKVWLAYLRVNGYIDRYYTPESFVEHTKPAIYYLSSKAVHLLKKNKNCDITVLNRVYRKKKKTETFIDHCLKIADIYLFLSQEEKSGKLHFFTESQIKRYDWLPDERPSAYIAVTSNKNTKRYFLELFYDYAPPEVYKGIVAKYLHYANSGLWEANRNNDIFPSILFVCTTKRKQSQVYFYAKSLFEKTFGEKFNLFLTTKDKMYPGNKNIWEKVPL